jgi:SAM-dependent methyltransferase
VKSDPIAPDQGRKLFGLNPEGYDRIRPDYPDALYGAIRKQCEPIDGRSVLEVGAGTGIATRRLLEWRCASLVALEPDLRFKPQLDRLSQQHSGRLEVRYQSFEDARLSPGTFDVILCATSFHWLDPEQRVQRMAELRSPGGLIVLLWNVFQVAGRRDRFHEATSSLLSNLGDSPSGAPDSIPFALRREQRAEEFEAGGFELASYVDTCWTLTLNPVEVGLLYESYASIQQLPEPERLNLLKKLKTIAESEFAGTVERNMTSVCYLFRRLLSRSSGDRGRWDDGMLAR